MELAPLAPLYERPGPWATVYVDTSVADEATLDRRALQARQIGRELAGQGADDATCRAVEDTVGSYSYGEGAAGHAVFATHGEVVLDPVLSLRPPAELSSTWAALPHVAPLLTLAPDEPDCLVARIDRTGADLELRTPVSSRSAGQVTGRTWPMHRTATADWSERHFQLSVENTWEQNARTIATAIEECRTETGAGLVVLAGDTRERRSVHEHLRHLPADVVETDHGGRAAGSETHLLDEAIEAHRHALTRRRTADGLERFRAARSRAGGTTDAAEGVPALIEAAREHRIDTLYLKPDGPDAHREVWAGPGPDQLALRRTDVRYLGEPEPFAVRADDALVRSAAMAGADVILVRPDLDPATDASHDLDARPGTAEEGTHVPEGGLGALLRGPEAGEHPRYEEGTG
ncbi:Vms1/Ankzf1 family peptidyl-tRNA hydrolase [Streptomyces sp. AM 4-1-1]|uniref:baeRF2 domain-containing protein n=1 Tax=unclassified Streptomyces TaxID=2593676 RepID=UPI0023B942F3|nr:Vms1/Ankzf1 family peptidyl-tRNA hydrolase [Streptomyces sp. AM 4-1-1]WEH37074.1 Vms1/Ankzf1 family peptidyl-tRNA hydrolase [Streptomyces sp. AM 4-1-1]